MPTNYPTTGYTALTGVTINNGTLSWTSHGTASATPSNVTDVNDDGNYDINVDYLFIGSQALFTGYSITGSDGVIYPILYQAATLNYLIPYDANAGGNPGANIPFVGSTSDFSDNLIAHPFCFAGGTLIDTDAGERPVETLEIGDLIMTGRGTLVPVKWIGRQTVHLHPSAPRMHMVRIQAGALGHGQPHSDLMVTADHGMVIPSSSEAVGENKHDGYVITAGALVNGHSIDFVPSAELGDRFTVYHIETQNHDVILANGAPSETFIDVASRRHFDNYQEYLDLYGHERIIPAQPLPRISTARLVPEAIQDRVARGSGHAEDVSPAKRA